jgi:hypothetical protein
LKSPLPVEGSLTTRTSATSGGPPSRSSNRDRDVIPGALHSLRST